MLAQGFMASIAGNKNCPLESIRILLLALQILINHPYYLERNHHKFSVLL